MGLIARQLETAGIPSLCLGSALDILEATKPPRSVFIDYPLGLTAGMPNNPTDQYQVTRAGLEAFETMQMPGAIL